MCVETETDCASVFLLIGTCLQSFEVMFAFQTIHSMNSLTATLGVHYSKVLFMLLLFSTKHNSFIAPCPRLLDKLQPVFSRSYTSTCCIFTQHVSIETQSKLNNKGLRKPNNLNCTRWSLDNRGAGGKLN